MDRDASSADSITSGTSWRASRRVVLKAAAAFGVLAATWRGGRGAAPVTLAGGVTRARRVADSDSTGIVSAAAVDSYRVLSAEFPFYAVGASWDGAVGMWPAIELSFSADGSSFTSPIVAHAAMADGGRPTRDDRIFSQLVFADGMSFIRYRVLDGNGDPARVESLQIVYIDASDGPRGSGQVSAAALPTLKKPAIVSRAGWGANESYRFASSGEIWPPAYRKVEHVIVHHTATLNQQDPYLAIRSIYYYHAVELEWGDIGYNYLVGQDGTIFQGRYGGDNVIGGHAYQYARGSSGIGNIGTFSLVDVSDATRASLIAIVAWVGRNLNPLGRGNFHETPDLPTICGHRDVGDTDCPGNALWADLPGLRRAVADVLNATEHPPDAGTPAPNMTFKGGDNVILIGQTNLRQDPLPTARVVKRLFPGVIAAVMRGSRVVEGKEWFALRLDGAIYGYVMGKYLDDAPVGNPPKPVFEVGDRVVAAVNQLRLRRFPGFAQDAPYVISVGSSARVISGPVAATGAQWYGVSSPSRSSGWVMQQEIKLARRRRVALSLAAGPANKSVTSTVSGFPINTSVQILVAGIAVGSATTDSAGNGTAKFRIPYLPRGVQTVRAQVGNASARTEYEILPRIDLSPRTGSSGASITARLSGYPANTSATVQWRNGSTWEAMRSAPVNGTGRARVLVAIPTGATGTISIRAVRGNDIASAMFAVTGASAAQAATPTATPTPPATPTSEPPVSRSPSPTAEATATPSPTPIPTSTATATPTESPTEVPTATPSETPTPTPTETPTPVET
jgi:hypothetical protein